MIKLIFLVLLSVTLLACGKNDRNNASLKKLTKNSVNTPLSVEPTKVVSPDTVPTTLQTTINLRICGTALECELIQKTNQIRLDNSVTELGIFSPCVLMAEDQAKYIANGGVFSHDRPEESYLVRSKRFGCLGGENIAYGTTSVDETLSLWMESTGHRENILYAPFKSMCR